MWLYVPATHCASSASSPGPADSSLESTTPFSALAPGEDVSWLMWRGKHTPARTWSQRWRKVPWMTLLSGLTSEPSTLARGVEAWISSLADFRVSRGARQAPAWAPTIRDTSGPNTPASSPNASPLSSSVRTSALFCLPASVRSQETFTPWVSALRLHFGQRRKLALRTAESDSSSLLPTPTASAYGTSNNGQRGDGTSFLQAGKESLMSMARSGNWPTPMASDSKRSGHGTEQLRDSPNLPAAVRMWPTPTSTLGTNGGLVTPAKAREGGTLTEALSARTEWATPTVHGNYNRKGASPDSGDGLATQVGGQLNADWVEWLMNWPTGWTGFASAATASSPSRPPARSRSAGPRSATSNTSPTKSSKRKPRSKPSSLASPAHPAPAPEDTAP